MSDELPVHIPTQDELMAVVVKQPESSSVEDAAGGYRRKDTPDPLSPNAKAFLRYAAEQQHESLSLEDRWLAIGIVSGAVKKRVLAELCGRGFIRLESRGRVKKLHLYKVAWEYLRMERPKESGIGGSIHKVLAERAARMFKDRGYDIHFEMEVGPKRKRVDVVAFGRLRLGIEIGLTNPQQEVRNLRLDLESGALDYVLFVTATREFLDKVEKLIDHDPYLHRNREKIRLYLLEDDGDE